MSEITTDGAEAPTETESAVVETQSSPEEGVSTEAESAEVVSGEGSAESEDVVVAEKTKRRNSFQERIKQMADKANDATARAEAAEQRATLLEQQSNQAAQNQTPYPTLEQYGFDEAQYQQAVIEHNASLTGSKVSQAMAATERAAAQQAQQAVNAALRQTFQERSAAFADEHPDYMAKVTSPTFQPSRTVANGIALDPKGPDIAYHLSSNPDVMAEINSLPATAQLMRSGQIAATLSTPVTPKTTTAPEPARVKSGNSAPQKDPEKMSGDEYAAWRYGSKR